MARTPDPHAICHAFDLGRPIGPMQPVGGGLSQRMWRLETTTGVYAIKRFNRDFENPDYVPSIERAFLLERRAFEAGITMPRPVPNPATGRCVAELPDDPDKPSTVRVHEWVEGRLPQPGDDWAALTRAAAAIMARIHALDLQAAKPSPKALAAVAVQPDWPELLDRARAIGAAWAGELAAVLPVIDALDEIVRIGRLREDRLIMCHRDIDAKNVLVTPDGGILLVDWDAAGPVSPRMEATFGAFTWAGAHDDAIDAHEHRINVPMLGAFFAGYRAAGGAGFRVERADFAEMLQVMMQWYRFNVRRALGERLNDADDRTLGEGIARQGFRSLRRYHDCLDTWVRIANDAMAAE